MATTISDGRRRKVPLSRDTGRGVRIINPFIYLLISKCLLGGHQ